ncbi:isochorismatase family cysteine hydrolase [Nocardioides sp. LHD-245]|uniref:cysteine hydrolase family protein n=1 Tax=Nocardioides sp. LHD-245 TaxID=3051387 RepID=UPI0027DF280E|nr:isochorismatase family cysteine hydrolase [Nocardioides sp. LHD-245]
MQFSPSGSALVIIDMQRYFLDPRGPLGVHLHDHFSTLAEDFYRTVRESLIPNLAQVLEAYRAARHPVVHVTTGAQGDGRRELLPHMRSRFAEERDPSPSVDGGLVCSSKWHEIVPELSPQPGEIVLNKVTRSAFTSTGLDSVLRNMGVEQILVGGVASDACVHISALDASDHGYWTFLLEDATAAFDARTHRLAVESFQRLWGVVLTSREATAALRRSV